MACHSFLDTSTASELCKFSSSYENELGQDMQSLTPRPKSSLNLAGLKAAFSSHHNFSCGNKSGAVKPANSEPSQKTLQHFFKDSVKIPTCNSNVNVSVKSTTDLAKYSPVRKSAEDGFRHGNMCSVTHREKDGAASSDFTAADCSGMDLMISPSVQNESAEGTSGSSHTVSGNSEMQKGTYTSREDDTLSPEAKRSRKEDPLFSTKHQSNTFLGSSEESLPSTVDAPACLQRRIVLLKFSLHELAERMRQLQELHKETTGGKLCYRRFRAKINSGENQSAEEELKREMR